MLIRIFIAHLLANMWISTSYMNFSKFIDFSSPTTQLHIWTELSVNTVSKHNYFMILLFHTKNIKKLSLYQSDQH